MNTNKCKQRSMDKYEWTVWPTLKPCMNQCMIIVTWWTFIFATYYALAIFMHRGRQFLWVNAKWSFRGLKFTEKRKCTDQSGTGEKLVLLCPERIIHVNSCYTSCPLSLLSASGRVVSRRDTKYMYKTNAILQHLNTIRYIWIQEEQGCSNGITRTTRRRRYFYINFTAISSIFFFFFFFFLFFFFFFNTFCKSVSCTSCIQPRTQLCNK